LVLRRYRFSAHRGVFVRAVAAVVGPVAGPLRWNAFAVLTRELVDLTVGTVLFVFVVGTLRRAVAAGGVREAHLGVQGASEFVWVAGFFDFFARGFVGIVSTVVLAVA
jgi:hypothetical protein